MNFTEIFIRRPVMTTLVMMSIVIFGIIAYHLLPVSQLPNIDLPTINVRANFPGASAETMAASIATPLEREFSTIAGLESMNSTSSLGRTNITLQFTMDRDIDAVAQDVQTAISRAQRQLPADMPTPPYFRKVNPADQPIIYIALSSPTLPLSVVNEYADTFIAQRISMINGVAQVRIYGSQKYAVRIQLDPRKLAAKKIGIDEVASAVGQGNVNLPTGTLYGRFQAYVIEANGKLNNAAAYRPLIVAYRNGAPVYLDDLGTIIDSVENDKIASWRNKNRSIMLAIQRQPGTNTVEVVDAIKRLLPTFEKILPASVNLDIHYDRSETIRESVSEVQFTLLLALCLVILVIFLFLRNFSATVIPSFALPISIIGTFAVMYLLDYTLDNMSLMALTLAVGFVVDDAIVMLENIVRHLEMGKTPLEAALDGSKEIGFTIVSITLSLVIVFIPVLFMGGILGRLLSEFAVTIVVSVLVSGFVSLSLTPMMCSRYLRKPEEKHHGRLYLLSERFFSGMAHVYKYTLRGVLRFRKLTFTLFLLTIAGTIILFKYSSYGFLPSEDTGLLFAFTEGPQGMSFQSMVDHQQKLAHIIGADPNVEAYSSNVVSNNTGRIFIRLKPRNQRTLSADELIQYLRPKLAKVPGIRIFLQNLPTIRIGGQLTKSQYQLTLQSGDTKELYQNAEKLLARLHNLAELQDVTSNMQLKNPQVTIEIDRDKASSLGISVYSIENLLYYAYGSRQVSTIMTPINQYRVILEVEPQFQMNPEAIEMLYVQSTNGQLVPLNTVAKFSRGIGPLYVNHLGQLPSVTISFNLKPGVALGDALGKVQDLARVTLPATISTSFQGTAQAFEQSIEGLGLLLIMAILVIYIILGILYESFIHPLTILSGLPAASFGALLTLMVYDMEVTVYAFVGIVMLIGIVKKNAIMMIDFAIEAQRKDGKSPVEAIFEGCVIRFRPIMMTTMSTLMATLPIAIGYGAGSETRRPLGMAVVGGLIFSQVLTLYITPVIYIYLEAAKERVKRWRKQTPSM